MICFAAIAPHGDVGAAPELREAMEELGRRFDAAAPEAAIVVTPHSVHVEGHFAVVTAAHVGEAETDRGLAAAVLEALREEGLPVLAVSFGGNDPAQAEMPLDWGTEIPLRFLRAERIVVVSPARDRPLAEHVRAGQAIRRASNNLLQALRIALVASADHGHAHDGDGPYGFDPASARYDSLLQEIVASGRLAFEPLAALAGPAKADSLWQLLVLEGAVPDGRLEQLAYAAPSYYGMLVAEAALS